MLVQHIAKQGLMLKNAGVIARAASYHVGHHKKSTMNELPVPAGDWQEQYARQNSRYNAILVTGVLVLAGTIGFAKSAGLVFLNYSPPSSLD